MEWREPFHCLSSSYTPHQRYRQNRSGFYYTFHVIFSSIPTCGGSLDTNGVTLTCAKTCAKVWSKQNSSDDDGGLSKRVSGQNNLLCVASLTFSRGVVVLLDASC